MALPGWSCCSCFVPAASFPQVDPHSEPLLHSQLPPACIALHSHLSNMEGRKERAKLAKQSPSNFSTCSLTKRKEAKHEQVGQMCSKRGFVFPKSPSFVMSRARARQKLRETCSNHRGQLLQRCSHSGSWRFRPVATNDLLRICTLASCPFTVQCHSENMLTFWEFIQTLAP